MKTAIRLLLAVGSLTVWTTTPATAEIYRWVDEAGRVHFQDHPPQEGASGLEVRDSSPRPAPEAAQAPPTLPAPQRTVTAPQADAQRKAPRTPNVELYTVAWCPSCSKAREFFRSRGISFIDYDIEKDSAAAARRRALDPEKGVPLAVVNGVKIRGYAPDAYDKALRAELPRP